VVGKMIRTGWSAMIRMGGLDDGEGDKEVDKDRVK
jgi:hypothetical protein